MLPPHSTRPTFLPWKRWRCASTAASPAAPAPSTTVFSISSSSTMACSMSPSSTSRIALTSSRTIGSVSLPGSFTAMPSAIVVVPNSGTKPWIAQYMEGKRVVSAPNTSIAGLTPLAATAIPAMMPPPPIGTTSTSRSGCAASISRAMVPCPAITFSSS